MASEPTPPDHVVWCVVCGAAVLLGPSAEPHFTDPDPRRKGATVHAGWCEAAWKGLSGSYGPVFREPVPVAALTGPNP